MLAVKNSIPSSITTSSLDFETLTVHIGSNDPTSICLVYNPPNSTEEYLLALFNYIRNVASLCTVKIWVLS